jgi:hypothetical protein
MTKSDDYLWDRSGDPDPDVARLESLLSPLRHDAPLDELRLRRKRSRLPIFIAILGAVAAMVAVILWWRSGGSTACRGGEGFAFSAQDGTVACEGATLAQGVLPVGGTLDTRSSTADLKIASIGSAELAPNTRVRLAHTSKDRHELFLERGKMHAKVVALPRIFAVATPSAQVVDLGCEYTIEIDDAGAGSICVQTGKVELETANQIVVVAPAVSCARLLAGRRAGLPYDPSASAELVAAIRAFEDGASDAFAVLAATRETDLVTLVNLVKVVPAAHKRAVLERLAQFLPGPQELTVDEALADDALLEMWIDEAIDVHQGISLLPTKP